MVLHTTLLQLSALKGCEDGLGEWIAARCGQYVPLGDDFIGGMFLFFCTSNLFTCWSCQSVRTI